MSKSGKLIDSTSENRSEDVTDFAGDLDAIAREGARRMLLSTLDAEVNFGTPPSGWVYLAP